MKKVMVTGCFDLLHSGHIAFLTEAAQHGELHVCIGSDANVAFLKGRYPVYTQTERKFMLEALRVVASVRINRGMGILDFLQELEDIRPDVFFVNEDGHSPEKADICRRKGIEYVVSRRVPAPHLPARSTTALRVENTIPYRIDLAGGWLDQPFVSKYAAGAVINACIEPTVEFNQRSGMATSTRQKAIELWKTALPGGNPEQLAKILFSYENPPGTTEVAGAQDAIGIVFPGLNKSHFSGKYWPDSIESCHDEAAIQLVENHVFLVNLGMRQSGYSVLAKTRITAERAQKLAAAAENCWQALKNADLQQFGYSVRASFEAQIAMFPNMMNNAIWQTLEYYQHHALGWKLSGAGGGGYLVLVAEQPIAQALTLKVHRRHQTV